MFVPDIDYDPIPAFTGHLLAELGIDADAVRETLADDQAGVVPTRRSPRLKVGGKQEKDERTGVRREIPDSSRSPSHRHHQAEGERT